jgi:peroxisomal 2,4-dienoyl-CoA reductase
MAASHFRPDLLAGRTALVTGGATGLGFAITRMFAAHGANVVICSRKEDNLRAACDTLAADGLDVSYVVCDVRRPDEVEATIATTLERSGRLDIVVNNAAGNFPSPIARLSPNGFRTVVDIDLMGTFNVMRAAHAAWMAEHGGSIVNISAAIQYVGTALQAHVASAKAGVDALSRTAAVEWGPQGVRVNVMAPGGMLQTEGVARITPLSSGGPAANPMRRYAHVDEMANAVLFLASDAASYVTGATLVVDGGGWLDSGKLSVENFERALAERGG